MSIDSVTILGLVAASLTTLAFLPQVFKMWRTKSAEDLSMSTFTMLFIGVALWLLYGLLIRDLPVIVSNSVTLGLLFVVLALAYRYRGNGSAQRPPA